MKKIEEIVKELIGMETDDFEVDVITTFGDYEFKSETEVIVSKDESNPNVDYQAYINHIDAPIICIKTEGNKIVDAWLN